MFFWIKDARFVVIPSSFLLFLPSSPDRFSWDLVCSYFPLGEDVSSSVFMATYGSLCADSFSWLQCHFTNGSKEGWPTAEYTLCFCVSCVHFVWGARLSEFLLGRFPFWDTLCLEWHGISAATKSLWNTERRDLAIKILVSSSCFDHCCEMEWLRSFTLKIEKIYWRLHLFSAK